MLPSETDCSLVLSASDTHRSGEHHMKPFYLERSRLVASRWRWIATATFAHSLACETGSSQELFLKRFLYVAMILFFIKCFSFHHTSMHRNIYLLTYIYSYQKSRSRQIEGQSLLVIYCRIGELPLAGVSVQWRKEQRCRKKGDHVTTVDHKSTGFLVFAGQSL